MTDDLLTLLRLKLTAYWENSGAWPGFIQAMRRSLTPEESQADGQGGRASQWIGLPGLCCQAAGGDPILAEDVTAAWYLFYVAAHLMDSVQDQDEPEAWWADLGPGAALSASTGLFFSAAEMLNHLHENVLTRQAASSILEDFSNSFLRMSGGQYRDITQPLPTLDQYWEVSAAKSGIFFALACRCGARLATNDPQLLAAYGSFGEQVGALVQIKDDMQDLQPPKAAELPAWGKRLSHSLAAIYAMEVLPQEGRTRLQEYLSALPPDIHAPENALSMIDQSGAGLYLMVEIERHRKQGLAALEQTSGRSPAIEVLAAFLNDLCKK